jgi:uncharacterized membrane protein (DUF4010 family)
MAQTRDFPGEFPVFFSAAGGAPKAADFTLCDKLHRMARALTRSEMMNALPLSAQFAGPSHPALYSAAS